MDSLPDSGIYCLVIRLDRETTIPVGKLGLHKFPAGVYLYTGSAQRNLRARVARHCRKAKKLRWHIDYLLAAARVMRVLAWEAPGEAECELNRLLAAVPGTCQLAAGFGSSDCTCRSHLTYVELPENPEESGEQRAVGLVAACTARMQFLRSGQATVCGGMESR